MSWPWGQNRAELRFMDFKPIPPDGKVADLRQQNQVKTQEQIAEEKQQKHDRVRRNLRLIALGVAAYYFISAGYSWYQESQLEDGAQVTNGQFVAGMHNPLQDPQSFRDTFNSLLNQLDTSLPLANANDSTDGFVAVLSTAIEIRGYARPNSKELEAVQIQTRYPDAFPPESLKSLQTFVLACERMADPNVNMDFADEVLRHIGLEPQLDANEDNKMFSPKTVHSNNFEYKSSFTSGPIDELTLVATPRYNLAHPSAAADPSQNSETASVTATSDSSDSTTATSAPSDSAASEEVIELSPDNTNSDVPQL